jgi:hypothetical protein
MKTILLLTMLLIPVAVFAGGRGHSFGGGRSYSGHHGGLNTGPVHVEGYTRRDGTHVSPYYRSRPYHHYRGSTGQGFDFSAYPTGSYSPDPPDFKYHSITPAGTPQDVYTWTDASGTVYFSDTPPAGKMR